jgi:hypothetical protein
VVAPPEKTRSALACPATTLVSNAPLHAINRTHASAPSLASSNTMLGKLPVK